MAKKNVNSEKSENGGKLIGVIIGLLIVIVWLVILVMIVKLDLFHFGSKVMRPILKDVPVLNLILPEATDEETARETEYPYSTLEAAITRIKELEQKEALTQAENEEYKNTNADLLNEIARLKVFEDNQTEFQQLKEEFYSDIVFGDKSPDEEVFKEWYEEIEPESAAEIYRQVASAYEAEQRVKDTAMAYEAMKPEQAAAILESMTSMDEVCDILSSMTDEARGEVLGAMDENFAAKVTSKLLP